MSIALITAANDASTTCMSHMRCKDRRLDSFQPDAQLIHIFSSYSRVDFINFSPFYDGFQRPNRLRLIPSF